MTITVESLDRLDALKRWAGRAAFVAILVGLVVMVRWGIPSARKQMAHLRAAARLSSVGAVVTTDYDAIWHGKNPTCTVYASVRRPMRQIDDELLVSLRDLENLESVSLINCGQITDAGLAAFENLTTLKQLEFGGEIWPSHITDAGLEHLKGLTSLTMLSLVGTQITDVGLAKLAGLKNLEELDLEGTQITDASVVRLMTMFPKLRMVSVGHTKVTPEALWKLLQAHHTLEIHDDAELDAMRDKFGGAQ
jgi:hypothetical protein